MLQVYRYSEIKSADDVDNKGKGGLGGIKKTQSFNNFTHLELTEEASSPNQPHVLMHADI